MDNEGNSHQVSENKEKNAEFFRKHLQEYSQNVLELQTYKNIHVALTEEVRGIRNLLDIGNGGVFDYDASVVGHITGLDLFLDQLPQDAHIPLNVTMEAGDALNVPKPAETFDGVVMVMLLHHLIGNSVAECALNLDRAIYEAFRVLRPGGKLVIIESCVPSWFYYFERLVFPIAVPVINRVLAHPPAFQYTIEIVSDVIQRYFGRAPTVRKIKKDKYVLQFGFKVPAKLTPVQPYLLTVCKA